MRKERQTKRPNETKRGEEEIKEINRKGEKERQRTKGQIRRKVIFAEREQKNGKEGERDRQEYKERLKEENKTVKAKNP